MRRSQRMFGPEDGVALARELESAHRTVVGWLARIPIGSPVYDSLAALSVAIHRAADAASGANGRLVTQHRTPSAPTVPPIPGEADGDRLGD